MLPNRLGYVMVYVSDMDRSVAFYRDTLGLPLRFQSPFWTEFATETVTLALHGGAQPAESPSHGSKPAGAIGIGWSVADLDTVATMLKERGVHFVMEPKDQVDEGIRLAVFLDPDGCAISLSQPLQ
jgi:lactoylglutathione lyase